MIHFSFSSFMRWSYLSCLVCSLSLLCNTIRMIRSFITKCWWRDVPVEPYMAHCKGHKGLCSIGCTGLGEPYYNGRSTYVVLSELGYVLMSPAFGIVSFFLLVFPKAMAVSHHNRVCIYSYYTYVRMNLFLTLTATTTPKNTELFCWIALCIVWYVNVDRPEGIFYCSLRTFRIGLWCVYTMLKWNV